MRSMKKIAALLLTAAMAVSMTGRDGDRTEVTEAADAEAPRTEAWGDRATDAATEATEAVGIEEGGKLLFFAIQNVGDCGINDLGYFASQDIAGKYGLGLTLVEGSNDASVRTTNLLDALETGDYDYCITASWYILDDLLAQVNEFDTKFIIYDTNPTLDLGNYPGCHDISFHQDEGSFLTATYQCLMSKTGQAGAATSQDAPILNDFLTGWLADVKYFNDDMGGSTKCSIAYLSDSTVQDGYETTSTLHRVNCGIVHSIAGAYRLGAAKACAEAGGTENGRCLVGVDYDQYFVFSRNSSTDVEGYENLVTSMEKKIQEYIVSTSDQMAGENCEISDHRFSLADGGVGPAYNEDHHKLTPKDVQKQLAKMGNRIKSGEIKVPSYFDFDDCDRFKEFRDNPDAQINQSSQVTVSEDTGYHADVCDGLFLKVDGTVTKELLRMEGVTKIYSSGFMANKGISFSINAGEIHALIGENGAGKTTLMKVLSGLENCQEGKIFTRGEECRIVNPLDAIAKGVGMIHQYFMLVPNLTVAENIVLGIKPGRGRMFDRRQAVQITKEASEKYQLAVDPNALVRNLNVELEQKVELLKALIHSVEVLILDKPTAVLALRETRDLFRQLKILREHGYGIIFISHKLGEIMGLCDSTTVLRHGEVNRTIARTDMDEVKLSRLIVGRDVVNEMERSEADCGETVLKVRNPSYVSDVGKCLMKDVPFGIRAGEIVGIAGMEDNGQTELLEMITGFLPIVEREVGINGSTTKGLNIRKIRDLELARISEDRVTHGYAPDLSVYNNLASIYLNNQSFVKGLFMNKKVMSEYMKGCIEEFETACDSEASPVRMLSDDNIQKVITAREFTNGTNLIIANQSTRGIDVEMTVLIRKLLHQYTKKKRFVVLLISSDLNEVLNLSGHLLVIRGGEFGTQFTDASEVTDEILGEYILDIKKVTSEGRGGLY